MIVKIPRYIAKGYQFATASVKRNYNKIDIWYMSNDIIDTH